MTTGSDSLEGVDAQALSAALDAGELQLVYHPQVCLASGRVVGAQAQVAWKSPGCGVVPPAQLQALIEGAGLQKPVARWALETACQDVSAWTRAGLPEQRVSVAAAVLHWGAGELQPCVGDALARAGLTSQALSLGVSEEELLEASEADVACLSELRKAGVEVVVSGFGAGLASLSSLWQKPVDWVRIDSSLLPAAADDPLQSSVTRALIQFAHGLQLRVIADGVKDAEQVRLLVEQGCDHVQGQYVGIALAADAFAALLSGGTELPRDLTRQRERQRTLLLVDDEEHILSALKRLFRREGYRLLTASCGAQALEVMAKNPVNVILSDQRMPGMMGVDFLRQAKQLYPDTVRMTLSGYTDLQSIIDAVNEGAVYKFLTKPWDDERLRDHVAKAFEQHELAEDNLRLDLEVAAVNRELASANQRLERMMTSEHDRRLAMQAAAGASRDMLDLLPVAVFGIGSEGVLAYANRSAIQQWPEWASALGDVPDAALLELVTALDGRGSHRASQGMQVSACGRPVTAWKRSLASDRDELGTLLILHEHTPVETQELASST